MRRNGEPNIPGITITSDGQVHLTLSSSKIDPLSDTYKKAVATCEDLLPAGTTLPAAPTPPVPAAPSLGFGCTGDQCPSAPKAPARPS